MSSGGSVNNKFMFAIICPDCEFGIEKPIFYCPRCVHHLLKHCEAQGNEIILYFESDQAKSIAVYRNNTPLPLVSVEINGPTIRLQLKESSIEQETLRLFEVLNKGEELWEIA